MIVGAKWTLDSSWQRRPEVPVRFPTDLVVVESKHLVCDHIAATNETFPLWKLGEQLVQSGMQLLEAGLSTSFSACPVSSTYLFRAATR